MYDLNYQSVFDIPWVINSYAHLLTPIISETNNFFILPNIVGNIHFFNNFYLYRKPILFANLQLPHKLPPVANPITVKSLPLPGFLEQTLSVALLRALSSISQERPKFPFITIKRSALIYMGLHLKGKQ